jgi:hypothetical protein
MKDPWIKARRDQLFNLLPSIYQVMDQAFASQRDQTVDSQGDRGPLEELLGVIAEQVNLLEDDLARWYDNLFIETCEDWVVPYLGDLVGYETPTPGIASNDDPDSVVNRIAYPRREVADTVALRRRKGSLALLEEISRRVVGWPARAIEYRRTTAGSASFNHLRVRRSSNVDMRDGGALDRLDTAYDLLPRTLDVRRINSHRTTGRHNLTNNGLFVCRRRIDSVTLAPVGRRNEGRATFDVQGIEVPLHVLPVPEQSEDTIATQVNLPIPLTRKILRATRGTGDRVGLGANPDYYGIGKSLFLVAKYDEETRMIPACDVFVNRLSDDSGFPLDDEFYDKVAIDPETGRMAFHPDYPPQAVWATYHIGKVSYIGGGEYKRKLSKGTVTHRISKAAPEQALKPAESPTAVQVERVLSEAKRSWKEGCKNQTVPTHSVIEIVDNEEYIAEAEIVVPTGKTLEVRAANFFRPVLRIPDTRGGELEICRITGEAGSHLILDGIMFSQGVILIEGKFETVMIRHCTFIPDRAQLELRLNGTLVVIEKSILGPISARPVDVRPVDAPKAKRADSPGTERSFQDPMMISIVDSTVDGRKDDPEDIAVGYAIAGRKLEPNPKVPANSGNAEFSPAHATLTLNRTTVLGEISVLEVGTISNSILVDQVCVDNCLRGCIRFSYIAPNSCTPEQFHCQPLSSGDDIVQPIFASTRFGHPDYLRLNDSCPLPILKGAEDQGEMGVYHDEFLTLRAEHLQKRIQEFIPAGNNAGIQYET